MIELITSSVYNGSITSMSNYFEWLPFYGYGWYLSGLLMITLFVNFIRNRFLTRAFMFLFISAIISLPILYVLNIIYQPTPNNIYQWWVIIQFVCFAVIGFINTVLIIGEYDSKEEYMNHVKEEHPDIWNRYFGDKEDEH